MGSHKNNFNEQKRGRGQTTTSLAVKKIDNLPRLTQQHHTSKFANHFKSTENLDKKTEPEVQFLDIEERSVEFDGMQDVATLT